MNENMEICADGIMDTKSHQRRNFEKNGNTERINDNNINKVYCIFLSLILSVFSVSRET